MIRQIGRYEIQAELGRGGFGRVYRAFDPKVARLVAIKTLTGGGEGEMLQRFHNEAAAAGRLHHKNIVTIYDFGEHEGEPFIVMELLQGDDLAKIIGRRTPLTLLQKMLIMAQVADGLLHAHLEGIVHRDVKPANIMVLPDGTVKLMDFGIALLTQGSGARLTKTGMVPGTLRYMAPEQFQGATNDPHSDIFAYGVTYYELLSYQHPFDGPTEPAMMFNILTAQPVSLREFSPECPEALEQVLLRAMHKERDLRYGSFEDLQDDLRPILASFQQQRGRELVEEAGKLFAEGQLPEARAALREGLDLDPGNAAGHRLRKELQQELQVQVTRPRVDALLATGREQLRERRFDEALSSFESALHLHPADSAIQAAISEARAARQQYQKADQLAYEAYQVLKAGDLTSAQQKASLAVETDPTNPRAVAIMQRIEETLRARERTRKLQAGLDQAKAALLVGSVQEAIGVLTALHTEFPAESEVEQLLDAALREKTARERRIHIEEQTAAAKELLRSARHSEAIHLLRELELEIPEAAEARDLLRQAEKELAVRRREETVGRATAEAESLARKERFQAALDVVDRALLELGDERRLQDLRGRIAAAESEHRRRKGADEARSMVGRLRGQRRFEDALRRIETFETAYGADPEMAALRRSIEEEAWSLKRAEAVAAAKDRARRLLAGGDPSGAADLLTEAILTHDAHAELSEELDRAQEALAAQLLEREISGITEEARRLAARSSFDEALAVLERGLAAHPGDPTIERSRTEIAASQTEHRRRLEREQALDGVRQALNRGDYADASQRLAETERQYGKNPTTAELRSQIQSAEDAETRRRALAKTRGETQKLVAERRFEEAVARLESALKDYSGDAELIALRDEASSKLNEQRRAEAVARAASETGDLLAGRKFDAALGVLDRALVAHPGEPALIELQRQATKGKAAAERERARRAAIETVRSAARRCLDADDPAGAVQTIESATDEVRRDASVAALLEEARAAIERKRQADEAVARLIAQVARMKNAGNFDEVLWLIDQGLRDFPGDARLLAARTEAESAKRAFEEEQARAEARRRRDDYAARINALADEERFPEALGLLDQAIQSCGAGADFESLRQLVEQMQERLRRALARQRELEELQRFAESVAAEPERKKAKELSKQARRLAKPYAKDADFEAVLARIEAELRTKSTTSVSAAPAAVGMEPARKPRVPRWGLAVAGSVVVAAAVIVFLVRQGGKPGDASPAPAVAQLPSPRAERDAALPIPPSPQPSTTTTPEQPSRPRVEPPASERRPPEKTETRQDRRSPRETEPPQPQPQQQPPPIATPAPDPAAEAAAAAQRAAAEQRLDDQRWAAVDRNTLASVRDFARQHPGSRHAGEAAELQKKLEWNALDKNNLAALEDYRRRATGEYANLAAREIERLRQAQLQAEQKTKREAQLQQDRQAILATLARHSSAYEKQDLSEILATWPGLPAASVNLLRKTFQTRGASVRMTLRPVSEPEIQGGNASVTCDQIREAVLGGARRNPQTRRVKVVLGRRGSGWIIEGIE